MIDLFQPIKNSDMKQISLKKLCRYVDKVNPNYSCVNMKVLFDHIVIMNKEEQIVFNSYFIQNKTLKFICEEFHLSRYKVRKNLKKSLNRISFNEEIFYS